ncbi:hypothetical protein P3X46_010901 [Hevea brasiliensis]|uniref:Uncharacterized protein n=1 Tax=Hevea brasiliensis TaxID=3981 RepID=A0ABQ9MFV6_HEVBR|nr:hypothetical protein P3X46_010901 [Hevea brasiliensis]
MHIFIALKSIRQRYTSLHLRPKKKASFLTQATKPGNKPIVPSSQTLDQYHPNEIQDQHPKKHCHRKKKRSSANASTCQSKISNSKRITTLILQIKSTASDR